MPWHDGFLWVLLSALALAWGSFANVLVYRLPLPYLDHAPTNNTRINIIAPRSHCPNCGQTLKWWHNLPLLGFLLLHGRCGFCRAPISARYWWIEFGAWLMALLCVRYFGWNKEALCALIFLYLLWITAWIDARHYLILDVLTYPLLAMGIGGCALWYPNRLPDALTGAVLGFALLAVPYWAYLRWRGMIGLGLGDCKLLAAIGAWFGAWLGIASIPYVLLTACLMAIGAAVFHTVWRERGWHKMRQLKIPFAPYLSAGSVLVGWLWQV